MILSALTQLKERETHKTQFQSFCSAVAEIRDVSYE